MQNIPIIVEQGCTRKYSVIINTAHDNWTVQRSYLGMDARAGNMGTR